MLYFCPVAIFGSGNEAIAFEIAPSGLPVGVSVDEDKVRRRFATVAARFDVEFDLLVFIEAAQTGTLDGGDVDEHVARAAIGLDEAETLGGVEPFHGAFGHRDNSFKNAARENATALAQSEQNPAPDPRRR